MSSFEVPKELMAKQLEVLEKIAKGGGKFKAGVNEVTKAIEREKAKLVFIALDVDPKEIVMHLPLICKEKKIPYTFVESKKELGEKAGIKVPTSALAVMDEGKEKKEVTDLAKKLAELQV
ncbi:MAG: 50S ribosomal protein L7Ae [Candidatus Diapherotrites archaeon]|nr:50S ribosomal protein L7Ae [Candidatus Diapherotrites archaeon]